MKQDTLTQPLQIFTKIQQALPSHCSTLPNKEVGYMVHVQTDKVYKIKNCVDSQKNNAELYKRFSKDFIANVKGGRDQMILCCGLQEGVRLETSIGCKKNPGMFLIAGIALLDEKYQEDFTKFDIQVSFMEYNDGKIYDLLSYTKVPLKMLKKQQGTSFGQSFCKISTFNQFLKLFRIALFNNKQRDQKNEFSTKNIGCQQKIKSSIIMTIITKKYTNFLKNTITQVQKNILIDFAGSRPSGFCQDSNHNSDNNTNGGQKNVWDYLLIQLNNLTCKKKMHYHLVQLNPLLCLIKHFLKFGKSFILASFSTNSQNFQLNYKYFSELYSIADSVTKQTDSTSNQIYSNSSTIRQKNQSLIDTNFVSEKELTQIISQNIIQVLQSMKNRKYQSLRQYRQVKQRIGNITKNCHQWFWSYRKIFSKMLENKRLMKLASNQIIADQIKLIGTCIKSDHYKDFYEAKGYLSLQRQISIKTQESKQTVTKLLKHRNQIKDKFNQVRIKNLEFVQSLPNENGQFTGVKMLSNKILQYFSIVFYNIVLFSQRTISDQVIKEQNINQNLNILTRKLSYLESEVNQMGKKGNIIFQINQFKKDAHLAILVKQVQNIVKRQQKLSKKRLQKSNQINKQNKDINQNKKQIKKQNTKFTKLPALIQKKISFQISGNLDLEELLFNPNEQQ